MADDSANEDSWLYGDSNPEPPANTEQKEENDTKDDESGAEPLVAEDNEIPAPEIEDKEAEEEQAEGEAVEKTGDDDDDDAEPKENGAATQGAEGEAADGAEEGEDKAVAEEGEEEEEDDDDDDSDDDDVQVTIGDIKTSTTYASINLKRGLAQDKNKQPGKFSIEEFEAVGTISGVPAHEFNLDSLEDKPWRKPGADITDYFNYGFNEDTWRAYCEKQKRIRIHDSGVGLMSLGGTTKIKGVPGSIPVQIINDNSKYSGLGSTAKAGPPPGRKFAGTIDVIGGNPSSSRRSLEKQQQEAAAAGNSVIPTVQENPIQVMTADRREYGRKPGFPDLSVPPPTLPPFDMPPPPIDTIPSYTGAGYNNAEFYPPEADPYYQSYEPTQDLQWGAQPWEGGGGSVGIATNVVIPLGGDNPGRKPRTSSTSDNKEEAPLEKERERHRESRHRHRSRSRSPERTERSSRSRDSKKRNKSRSRSPHRHRSKKKSRRERDESD